MSPGNCGTSGDIGLPSVLWHLGPPLRTLSWLILGKVLGLGDHDGVCKSVRSYDQTGKCVITSSAWCQQDVFHIIQWHENCAQN